MRELVRCAALSCANPIAGAGCGETVSVAPNACREPIPRRAATGWRAPWHVPIGLRRPHAPCRRHVACAGSDDSRQARVLHWCHGLRRSHGLVSLPRLEPIPSACARHTFCASPMTHGETHCVGRAHVLCRPHDARDPGGAGMRILGGHHLKQLRGDSSRRSSDSELTPGMEDRPGGLHPQTNLPRSGGVQAYRTATPNIVSGYAGHHQGQRGLFPATANQRRKSFDRRRWDPTDIFGSTHQFDRSWFDMPFGSIRA